MHRKIGEKAESSMQVESVDKLDYRLPGDVSNWKVLEPGSDEHTQILDFLRRDKVASVESDEVIDITDETLASNGLKALASKLLVFRKK